MAELHENNDQSNKFNNDVIRTSSFKEQIQQKSVSRTSDNILDQQITAKSPRRYPDFSGGRSISSVKYSSDRSLSESPRPRRERSFLRATSRDKMFRKPTIWAQWEVTKQKEEDCLQAYNIKQMTGLYGKDLSGKAELAQEWYRVNGLDRSKTQMEALDWLYSVSRCCKSLNIYQTTIF